VSEFKWLPHLHQILSTRPNQIPIAITTGIGPAGPSTVLHQRPSPVNSEPWEIEGASDADDSSSVVILDDESSSEDTHGKGKNVAQGERMDPGVKKDAKVAVKEQKVSVKEEKVVGKGEKVVVKEEKVVAKKEKAAAKEEKVAVKEGSMKAAKGKKVSEIYTSTTFSDIKSPTEVLTSHLKECG
jgi:hypothetical protein